VFHAYSSQVFECPSKDRPGKVIGGIRQVSSLSCALRRCETAG
jgi:hypothetical protein